jgi:hypothetical protein
LGRGSVVSKVKLLQLIGEPWLSKFFGSLAVLVFVQDSLPLAGFQRTFRLRAKKSPEMALPGDD